MGIAPTALLLLLPGTVALDYQPGEQSQLCLECHKDFGARLSLVDGTSVSMDVDTKALGRSVHREQECTDCHQEFSPDDHPRRSFDDKRSLSVRLSGLCMDCHDPNDGIHGRMLDGLETLVCTDCHGAHDVQPIPEDGDCSGCHRYRLNTTFEDGQKHSVRVDPLALSESVHAEIACTDCHTRFSRGEHPVAPYRSARDLTLTMADSCKQCHFDKYTRTLESIHYRMLKQGNQAAPGCVDCHGAHSIASGTREKRRSARRCRSCHEDIYTTYTGSVHGKALLTEHNEDVPVCSDCHQAHGIADPRTTSFHNLTPQLCADCHADETLMTRYGLSSKVLASYLQSFHGVTASFYQKEGEDVRHIAVCTDCHGVHDITSLRSSDPSLVKTNLLERCKKCHPNANTNFPDSWISHYEPSLHRAPLVYLVSLGYSILIPFMLIGLLLQILLHVWRYSVKR